MTRPATHRQFRDITPADLPQDRDAYIAAVVASAPPLDADTLAQIRALIPPIRPVAAGGAA